MFMCDRETPVNLVGKEHWTEEENLVEFARSKAFVKRQREEKENAERMLQSDVGESQGH